MDTAVDLRLKSFCSLQLTGASNSGKSTLSVSIALNRRKVYDQDHEAVIYYFQHEQPLISKAKEEDDGILFLKDKDQVEEELAESNSTLLICDDILAASGTQDHKFITDYFLAKSHHNRVSFVLQSQLVYHPSTHARAWMLNTNYFCLFRNFHQQQMVNFFRNLSPKNYKFIHEAYLYCTENQKYGHFFMSLHPADSDLYRYRSNVIPSEGINIFMPKDGSGFSKFYLASVAGQNK